ncbi:MAG: hypothetical protein ACXWK2_09315 [Rhizomicrobium sp.]
MARRRAHGRAKLSA